MSFYPTNIPGSQYITNGFISSFNSNTLGNLYTTGGNIGINNTAPSTNLDVNGNIKSIGLTTSNLNVTNSSIGTLNISNGLTTGNINFTGSLYQNGAAYLGSQWTTTASNLSYTSGNVILQGLTSGSHYISSGGSLTLASSSSGSATITTQTSSGNYNFNLPTSAGPVGSALISGGGGSTPMTWGATSINSLAVMARYQTTATTVPTNTFTTITFDTLYSNYSIGNTGFTYSAGTFTNSNAFTVTIMINTVVSFAVNATGSLRYVRIIDSNGIIISGNSTYISSSGITPDINASGVLTLASGASFSIQVYQSSGSSLTTLTGTNTDNNTSIQLTLLTGSYAPTQTNILSKYLSTTGQTVGNGIGTIVTFDTADTLNSLGSLPLSYSAGTFTNTGTSPLPITINFSVSFSGSSTTGIRVAWIQDNNNNQYSKIDCLPSTDALLSGLSGSATLILSVSGSFSIQCYQNNTGSANIVLPGGPGIASGTSTRIQIVGTTAGASGGTVNATSTSNTLGSLITSTSGNLTISNGSLILSGSTLFNNTNQLTLFEIQLWQGTVGSGTQLNASHYNGGGSGTSQGLPLNIISYIQPSSGSVTYNVGINGSGSTNTITIEAASTYPAYIVAELV